MSLGGSSKCPRCAKAVYFAEEVSAKGKKWHKSCLTCGICKKGLDTFTLNEYENNVYCKGCYAKNFGPKGYGFAAGGGGVVAEGDSVGGYHAATLYGSSDRNVGSSSESSANDCPRCKKPVYYAEEKLAIGRKWHKLCFKCGECKKMLDSSTVAEHDGDAFCKTCYGKLFGPRGYGFAGGSAGLSANADPRFDDSSSSASKPRFLTKADVQAEQSAVRSAQMTGGGAPACAGCGSSVYFAEEVIAAGRKWHKLCLKCDGCGKLLDSGSLVEHEGVPHCRACYGKRHGPKGYGFAAGAAGLSANHDGDD